ncbi:MAG: biotin/lipoyl-binding protein, partial [Candidatus Eisenbacteria sp.]|nr:biotin/lipoyl-binding protein [Candidatus Eisenbacteria bacterium]
MTRKKLWILVAVVVVLGGLVTVNLASRRSHGKEVQAEKVRQRSLETWVRSPGWIQPITSVDISSNVTGRVEKLHVREGEAVRKGQLLLTLDDTRLRSAVQQYEAMLGAARSQLTLTEAQRDLAEQILTRRENLFGGGLLSSEELEAARVELRVAQAQMAAQRDEVKRLRAALEETRRNLAETRFLAP